MVLPAHRPIDFRFSIDTAPGRLAIVRTATGQVPAGRILLPQLYELILTGKAPVSLRKCATDYTVW